jgi:hypothetical protein
MSEIQPKTLAHVGVMGMRWGVHAANAASALSRAGVSSFNKLKKTVIDVQSANAKKRANPDNLSEDQLTVNAIKKKKLSELSNKDIQTLAARADLETKYRQIMTTPEDVRKKQTMATLGKYGGQAATLFIKNFTPQAAKFAESFMEKKFGMKTDTEGPSKEGIDAAFTAAAKHLAETAFTKLAPGVKAPSHDSIEKDLRDMVKRGEVRIVNGKAERVVHAAPTTKQPKAPPVPAVPITPGRPKSNNPANKKTPATRRR